MVKIKKNIGGNMYRVIVWGLGNMGSGMVKLILKKPSTLKLVAGIDVKKPKGNADVGEMIGLGQINVPYYTDPAQIIKEGAADIVLLNINSFTKAVFKELKMICEAKISCITIAEEMSYPWAQEKELARELDKIARENDVTILGTGINPGFVLDTLIVSLTGVCLDVERIEASRINDLSPFGKTVMETQGVGTTVEEFEKGLKSGKIVGHVGFPESISMIFEAMGWELGKIEQERDPIISKTYRETDVVKVEPGMVAGCRHIGIGFDKDGKERVRLIHPQQIHPDLEAIETGDYIKIYGDPFVSMSIKPEIPGGKGTIAMAVNMIPHVKQGPAGLLTMIDLPVPRSIRNI